MSPMTRLSAPLSTVAEAAAEAAHAAAGRSGVRVAELRETADLQRLCALFGTIWRAEPGGEPPMITSFLRALCHTGNYVTGAFDGDEMVGACVGVYAEPAGEVLHSHMAGVAASARARNIGYTLKLHQRAWALARGIKRVTWTYDPLIRRNAHFNITKLGALPTAYFTDFYGPMEDAVNGGTPTDRVLVEWRLDSGRAVTAASGVRVPAPVADAPKVLSVGPDGLPLHDPAAVRSGSSVVLAEVPADIERMRRTDRANADAWRATLREVLGGLFGAGAAVTGFSPANCYVIDLEAS
ncbi:GNAT family N-acetyltransferase [Spongiactinospora gelatinilytica]|uniref:GNAT family N-acetyltransferase n=2 Tax=Spongiactinospora gelatinilytica TaxID=2666298 RepID=A0A2W2HT09_9ACTN|nr:GNAT family N-acetyltransferase [Spongiactinospora gelatinilytica]